MKKELSVIIPIYNEKENILELYLRLVKSIESFTKDYELIFINDGSKDDSLTEIIKLATIDEKIYYINFSRNFGHQIAVSAGLDKCRGNCTIIIDADLQDPPELIPELYEQYINGFDVVYAQRRMREGETYLKKITAKAFYRILQKITDFKLPLDAGDFRLLSRKVVQAINSMPEKNKFLRAQIAWLGFKQTQVLFNRESRKHGITGYSYGRSLKMAFDGITGFSDKPLLFVSRVGLGMSFISFIIIIYALFSHFVLEHSVTGWTSLIISSMFIGGIQLLSVGILGEYIARINKDVKQRPLYIIEDTNIEV